MRLTARDAITFLREQIEVAYKLEDMDLCVLYFLDALLGVDHAKIRKWFPNEIPNVDLPTYKESINANPFLAAEFAEFLHMSISSQIARYPSFVWSSYFHRIYLGPTLRWQTIDAPIQRDRPASYNDKIMNKYRDAKFVPIIDPVECLLKYKWYLKHIDQQGLAGYYDVMEVFKELFNSLSMAL